MFSMKNIQIYLSQQVLFEEKNLNMLQFSLVRWTAAVQRCKFASKVVPWTWPESQSLLTSGYGYKIQNMA